MPKTGQRKHPAYRLYQWFWHSLDWLYPPVCGGCERTGVYWCEFCQQQVVLMGVEVCPICGDVSPGKIICQKCASQKPNFTKLLSWGVFQGPLRNALHRLKYKRDIGLGEILSQNLIRLINNQEWDIELVTPVPLSDIRQKERGYNQAALLAYPLALACGLDYSSRVLRRVKETRSQVGLSFTERKENVYGAFQANPRLAAGKSILIVDDVATTGATLEACSRGLIEAGAAKVYSVTLARAVA